MKLKKISIITLVCLLCISMLPTNLYAYTGNMLITSSEENNEEDNNSGQQLQLVQNNDSSNNEVLIEEEPTPKEEPKKNEVVLNEEPSQKEEQNTKSQTRAITDYPAYAVLKDNGDLIFFRSPNSYSNNNTGTFTDVDGNEYTGRVFANVETNGRQWYSYRNQIKNVKFQQTIQPTNLNSWFDSSTALESIDWTNFDASKVTTMSSMFWNASIEELDLTWLADINRENFSGSWGNFSSTQIKKIKLPNTTNELLDLNGYYKNGNTIISEPVWNSNTGTYTYQNVPAGTYTRVDSVTIQATIKCSSKVDLPIELYFNGDTINVTSSTTNFETEDPNYWAGNDYKTYFGVNSNNYQLYVTEDNDSTPINRKYTIQLDVPQTTISGTIEWKEDDISNRPDTVTLKLYQNGEVVDSQEISSSETSYLFRAPVRDANGKIYDYEVKEDPVTNYVTTYEDIDAMQLLFYPEKCYNYGGGVAKSNLKASYVEDYIEGFYFRRHGKWYYMTWNGNYYFDSYRNKLIIPGDAVYIKFKYEGGVLRKGVDIKSPEDIAKHKSAEEEYDNIYDVEYTGLKYYDMDTVSTEIADSWDSYEAGTEINVKSWYNRNRFLSESDDGRIIVTPLDETDESMAAKNFYEDKGVTFEDQVFLPLNKLDRNRIWYNTNTVLYGSLFRTNIFNVSKDVKIEVKGTKVWADEDRDPPQEVTIRLLQNGKLYKEETITANDNWKYSFKNVPKFNENGEEYVYTVSEKPIKGYKYTLDSSNKGLKVTFKLKDGISDTSAWWNSELYFFSEEDGKYYEFGSQKKGSGLSYRPYLSPSNLVGEDGTGTLYFPTTNIYMLFTAYNFTERSAVKSLEEWLTITKVELVDNPYEQNEYGYFWNNKDGGEWTVTNYLPPNEVMSKLDKKGLNDQWTLYNLFENGKVYNSMYYDGVNYDIEEKEIDVINKYYEGDLSIVKTDGKGNPIKNTLFSLYWTENTVYDEEWTKAETTPTATGQTDENGNLVIRNIPYGCYLLEETPAAGYTTPSKPWKVVVNTNGTVSVFDENGELVPISGTTLSQDETNGLRLVFDDGYPNNAALYFEEDGRVYQVVQELTGTVDIPSKNFYVSAVNATGEMLPEWRSSSTKSMENIKDDSSDSLTNKFIKFLARAIGIREDYTIPNWRSGGVETTVKFKSVDPINASLDNRNFNYIGTVEEVSEYLNSVTPITDISLPIEINESHDTYKYTYQDPNYLVSPEREQEWQNSAIQIKFGDVVEGNPDGEVAIFVSDGTKIGGEYVPTHYVKLTNNQLDDTSSIKHKDGFYVTDAEALANKTITVPGVKVWIWDNWATSDLPLIGPIGPVNPPPVDLRSASKAQPAATKINIESIELVDSNDYSETVALEMTPYMSNLLFNIPTYYKVNTVINLTGNAQALDPQSAFDSIIDQFAKVERVPEEYFEEYYEGSQTYGFAIWAYEKPKLQNDSPIYGIDNTKTRTEIRLINTDGDYVPDGVLELYDKEGNLVDRWTTTDDWYIVEGLTEGETYTIKNPEIPFIYNFADDKEFDVLVGEVTKVTVVVDPAPKVEISNTIRGAEYASTDELTFEITLENARKNVTYPINIGDQTVNVTTDANGNGTATFTLKDGDVAILNTVHKDTKVTVKELESDYYASYTATRNSDTIEENANLETHKDISTSDITMTNDDLRIDFVNELNITIPTGVANTTNGIILGLLVMLALLAFIGIKKKKSVSNKAE